MFIHQFRNNKLPISFSGIFTDITNTDELQTRHNDFNYFNPVSYKKYLEHFPYKQMLLNWNSLNIDLKSTADNEEFQQLLKDNYLSNYSYTIECTSSCFSCGNNN